MSAITEWNNKNQPHCVFIPDKTNDCVRFLRDDTTLPNSKVGYYTDGTFISIPLTYPTGEGL